MHQSILRNEELNKQLTEASALHVAYHEDTLCPIVGDALGEPFTSAGRVPPLDVDAIRLRAPWAVARTAALQTARPRGPHPNESSIDLAGQEGEALPWAPGLRE